MKSIPCVLMRGGTSKGAFLLADDLPKDIQKRDECLLTIMGSGHELEIDGIGGGSPQTREGANKQVISSQADSLIKISRIWADFFPANTSN